MGQVYISYSWSAENEQPLVEEIGAALRAAGLDFRRDVERIGYGESIKKFMHELGAAGNIVTVLSPAYFQSEYCMYELLLIWKSGNFSRRAHPVCLETLALDDAGFQSGIIDYWHSKASDMRANLTSIDPGATLDLQKRATVCAEIYREIGSIMPSLASTNCLSLKTLQAQKFQPLIGRIRPSSSSPSQAEQRSQAEFERKIREFICESLMQPHLTLLTAALGKQLYCENPEDNIAALVDACWNQRNPLARIEILQAATKRCLEQAAQAGNADDLIEQAVKSAKQILVWLAMACMSQDWMNRHHNERNPYHDAPLDSLTSIELYAACLKDDLSVGLFMLIKPGEVVGEGCIELEKHGFYPETGWQPEAAVEQTVKAIWKAEYNESKSELSEVDRDRVSRRLKRKGKYIPVHKKAKNHPLLPGEVCELLRKSLPGVTIIHFACVTTQEGEDSPLMVKEGELLDAIDAFLEAINR